ncbi:RNA ligase [Candidatus Methylacidiphilum infernorum]|uniref:ATP-dependent DNA ligase n=1 Tax=Methylacidiphilum infernorum (isolate V4) TaxID=481448 RepID=B3DWH3_METI4|nr:RNA ligase [Candidatus Methylacidiphilum infernorum]ACD82068.1 ATP-dependent DNA ligase [Methylacidiphilum infernorum V4]
MYEQLIEEILQSKKGQLGRFWEYSYVRLTHAYKGWPEGTVFLKDLAIAGFPKIGRINSLEPGLREQFPSSFWMEEKVDGYNVRIFQYKGKILCATRGGFLCPFSTDRIGELMPLGIFNDHPSLVLCGEIAGPDNPYIEGPSPLVQEDIKLFIFDIAQLPTLEFLPQRQKQELICRYGLPSVKNFGLFKNNGNDLVEIKKILLCLHNEYREGAVFKEEPFGRYAKYVTAHSDLNDIAVLSHKIMDISPNYFIDRILRYVLFLIDMGIIEENGWDEKLGKAFISSIKEVLKRVKEGGKSSRLFRCRFRNPQNAQYLIDHLKHIPGHQEHVIVKKFYKDKDYWYLEFEKIFPATGDSLRNWLSGALRFD